MHTQARTALLVLAAGCSVAMADLPASTKVMIYKNGNPVSGMGPINSPFNFTSGASVGGPSFRGLAINNGGDTLVRCGVYAPPPFTEAILRQSQGLVAYVGAGFWGGDTGAVGVPTGDYAMLEARGIDLNNQGTPAMQLLLGQGDFGPEVTPTSGVSFDRLSLVAQEGGTITAAGVAPGATYQAFSTSNVLGVNDSNVFLVGANITESGLSRRALLKIAADSSGAVLSTTVVAKEGGLVGAGPATWTAVSIAPNSAAINNAGQVVFSGVTSAGVNGVYRDGALIAYQGGPTPLPGQPWGSLLGASVDINASGKVAFRGFYGDSVWTEVGDAGETFAGANPITDGTLANITGSLLTDHDVDFYRIRISDYTAFSATTVPAPGFPGSTGDTVLYLFRDFSNANGITRIALSRNDNSAGGQQSTVTAVNLPADTGNGAANYYLAVATPKSRPVDSSGNEFWVEDPAALVVAAGKVYWSDPSEGTIRRADATTGVIDPVSYPASVVPRPYAGQTLGTGKLLPAPFVVSDSPSASTIVWPTSAWAQELFHTADPENFSDTAVALVPAGTASDVSGMAVDNVNGKVYWTRADTYPASPSGFLNRSNLDGSGVEILIGTPSTDRPRHLAVDPVGSKIYWTDAVAQTVVGANLDGSSSSVVATGVSAGGIAVDPAAGKVYWSVPSAGIVERANTDGSARETFKSGLSTTTLKFFPAAITISGGSLYYADVRARSILKMPTASLQPAAATLVSLGGSTSDTASDSFARLGSLGSWVRDGAPSAAPVPYQVKLTGAVAFNQQAMIAINNSVKVAAVGDSPAAIAPATFTVVGDAGGPLRISDSGLVAYRARWVSGSTRTGLFLGSDKVFDGQTVPTGATLMGDLDAGAAGFDMSDSGQYVVTSTGRSLPNFSFEYLATKISFESVPQSPCPADLGVSGGLPGQDGLLDNNDFIVFINYFFGLDPLADVGVAGGLPGSDGQFDNNDFIAFINLFFAGC